MRKGTANGVIPDESGQLIGEETERETRCKAGEKQRKNGRKKTAAGQAAVFDEAL
ncbi:TPA: hypothetical protein QDC55_001971 [Burkholderia cenocepacia]|nr:hypothetical protein [Burkholderia cenocepacia]HDR9811403.1 hypothetical protein [Burkholderia cenocepacia]HDR9818165.1 hypothetical protein [Burkholderia cenocepacia]HDR9828431.1 hypothetical protein [Burkholderia cenocepacia]